MGYTKFQADLLVLHQDPVDIGRVLRTMSELVHSAKIDLSKCSYISLSQWLNLCLLYFGNLRLRSKELA